MLLIIMKSRRHPTNQRDRLLSFDESKTSSNERVARFAVFCVWRASALPDPQFCSSSCLSRSPAQCVSSARWVKDRRRSAQRLLWSVVTDDRSSPWAEHLFRLRFVRARTKRYPREVFTKSDSITATLIRIQEVQKRDLASSARARLLASYGWSSAVGGATARRERAV